MVPQRCPPRHELGRHEMAIGGGSRCATDKQARSAPSTAGMPHGEVSPWYRPGLAVAPAAADRVCYPQGSMASVDR